ncbi:Shedu anti-phage system protein SduA domain-containing protein [Candidatus Bipolaricaulota bacterium]
MDNTSSAHAVFLGIADLYEALMPPYPDGPINLFQLAARKPHVVFPAILGQARWIILVNRGFLESCNPCLWSIQVDDDAEVVLVNIPFKSVEEIAAQSVKAMADESPEGTVFFGSGEFVMLPLQIGILIPRPGKYHVCSVYDGEKTRIGSVEFIYQKTPSLTPDQIVAINSNPDAAKSVKMKLGCKSCGDNIAFYTALARSSELESGGLLWYADLPDRFSCQCGKANLPLHYLRESMHAFLLQDLGKEMSGLSYVRRYGHREVIKTAKQYTAVLGSGKGEAAVQRFIEKHPILLAHFGAKRLFIKPSYLGRHFGDFAVLDTQDRLWLIELERPTLNLFKKDRHPRAELLHAYGQVNDWLYEYQKYPAAVLEGFSLAVSDVSAVRGAVIAGRRDSVTQETLQRHLSNPPYPHIDFMTLDDLATSMLEVSKRLA